MTEPPTIRVGIWQRRQHEAEQFTDMVETRGRELRTVDYEELLLLADEPTHEVTVGKRKGQIAVIVERCDDEKIKVVVPGFIRAASWLPPQVKGVALHGFYKYRDGHIAEMRNEEFYGYD